MKFAKAMALGGEYIHAVNCNFSSFDKLKLRCCVCGEPVYLRKGDIRKPHFSHFPGTDTQQVEECEIRAYSISNSLQSTAQKLPINRGQKLQIFQNHFLDIISNSQPEFENTVQKLKATIDQSQLENITQQCTDCFWQYRETFVRNFIKYEYREKINKELNMNYLIALEAIDYLCVKSSKRILEQIIYYILYTYTFGSSLDYPMEVSYQIAKVIFYINWVEEFVRFQDKLIICSSSNIKSLSIAKTSPKSSKDNFEDNSLIKLLPKRELNNSVHSETKVSKLPEKKPKSKKKQKNNIKRVRTSCPECLMGLNLIELREHILKEHKKDKVYCRHCHLLLDRRYLAIHLIKHHKKYLY